MVYREGTVFGLISGRDLPAPLSSAAPRATDGVSSFRVFEERMNVAEPTTEAPRPETLDRRLSRSKLFALFIERSSVDRLMHKSELLNHWGGKDEWVAIR